MLYYDHRGHGRSDHDTPKCRDPADLRRLPARGYVQATPPDSWQGGLGAAGRQFATAGERVLDIQPELGSRALTVCAQGLATSAWRWKAVSTGDFTNMHHKTYKGGVRTSYCRNFGLQLIWMICR